MSLDSSAAVAGLVMGGLLGDALGGPTEFQEGPHIDAVLPNLRRWPDDRRLTAADRRALAEGLQLRSYSGLRPQAEPYGPWSAGGPAGTVTDDSRHKIVLMRTLQRAIRDDRWPVTAADLAREYLAFTPHEGQAPDERLLILNDEGFREYRYAARWLLGDRDEQRARPVERLWSGVANCSGQMLLLPLAAAFPGQPEQAYRAAFMLDFVDAPIARDLAASMVAALASVMDPATLAWPAEQRWQRLLTTLRQTDPWGFAAVPFAGRPWIRWLDQAETFATDARGDTGALFRRLETDGQPVYWWDAHFTLLVPLACLHHCQFDPLATLHLTLDFRHDSDSYAQVLGAMIGAVHGQQVFPQPMRDAVAARLSADYGESCQAWCEVLAQCASRAIERPPLVAEQRADS
jgi:ADP-ribosylglycohydrolase